MRVKITKVQYILLERNFQINFTNYKNYKLSKKAFKESLINIFFKII